MKFSLKEWQNIVAALRLAAQTEARRYSELGGTGNSIARASYFNAQRYADYADRIEATKIGG